MTTEPVLLADGPAQQGLLGGVAPLPLMVARLAAERRRRDARHGAAALPSGGLFDQVARDQQDLFG